MTTATHAIAVASSPRRQTVGAFLKRDWAAFWTGHGKRTTARMLRSLDDATLRDIGLSRSEIDSVVYGTPGDRRLNYDGH